MPPNYIKDGKKRCNGPLHEGEYVALDHFWFHKTGKRVGKPFSQCQECLRFTRNGEIESGSVPWERVKFVFDELTYRLGKMEAMRRIGVSPNYINRRKHEKYKNVRRSIVARAMRELKKCREISEVRHRKSIRYGAYLRGQEERKVKKRSDFYNRIDSRSNGSINRELSKTHLTS